MNQIDLRAAAVGVVVALAGYVVSFVMVAPVLATSLLAAQAPLSPAERGDPSLIRNRSDAAPSLSAVGDADPVALLVAALERLVQRVGLLREAAG